MNVTDLLLPDCSGLQVDKIEVESERVAISVASTKLKATCPYCQTESTRVNMQYSRKPADLPCAGQIVQLQMTVRCFFCDNAACEHRTFAERFPEVVAPYARRTDRLVAQQRQVAFEVSGEAGARLLAILAMPISPDTVLRLVRSTAEPEPVTPRILGVDDWAMKKGQTYGTILVDHETQRPIDVLPERSAESLEEWLAAHPGIEVITRDRATDYAAGATAGAPEATQVADRFHLLQNLTDTLKRIFERQPKQLRTAAQQAAEVMNAQEEEQEAATLSDYSTTCLDVDFMSANDTEPQKADEIQPDSADPTAAQLRFDEVKSFQAEGWSQRAVASHLQMSRRTVRKYWSLDEYPQRPKRTLSGSSLTPYLSYLIQRWQEGCQNRKQPFAEVQEQGYTGSYSSVWRAFNHLAADETIIVVSQGKPLVIPSLSAQRAAWLFSIQPDDLAPEQQHLRDALLNVCPDAADVYSLAQSFRQMIRDRTVDALDGWLLKAQQSVVGEFQRFAKGMQLDYAAVKAALQYSWSNGPVEGQVNRLKFIKCQMYGRANFDLLRKRVLGYPVPA